MTALFQALLDSSIRISIVALAVWLSLILGRVRSASLRHTAWLAVLCSMLLMPVLPYAVPPVHLPVAVESGGAALVPLAAGPPAIETPPALPRTSAPAAAASVAPEASPERAPIWPAAVLFAYLSGVLVLFARLVSGWLSARRVLRASTRIVVQNLPVRESILVSAPVTVGLKAPKILLPADWSQWPEDKLEAVLAHEIAHVARRDTLTGFLAQVNRCVFWFHPLAWWLERQLAIAAENACDDAGVRAIGETRRYAEVLLDMAEAVRRQGHRLALQGVGADGSGLLGHRIDRILRGGPFHRVSGTQKAVVALSCGAAIWLVAACREKSIYTAELKPDPEYAAQQIRTAALADLIRAARAMNASQVADLEAAVNKNPEDLEARKKLIMFYQTSGVEVVGSERTIARFRAHKLWMIRNHPESDFALLANPLADPASYEQEKKLWLALVEGRDTPAAAVSQAAVFFESRNPQLAEGILLRAQAADSNGHWSRRLGSLYAAVLMRPNSQGGFAQTVRQKLQESKDPVLLAETGSILAFAAVPPGHNPEIEALGVSCLERALRFDPNSARAHTFLESVRIARQNERLFQTVGNEPSEAQYKAAAALPEGDRFRLLPVLAEQAYIHGNGLEYYQHDLPGAKRAWELARKYAQNALRLAPRFGGDAGFGTAVYQANMTLGTIAMRVDGDRKAAAKYLLAASRAPPTDELAYSGDYFTLKLPVLLLKYGGPSGRKAVIEYLERFGRTLHRPDMDLLAAARQLRQGYMPVWFQRQADQLK